MSSPATLTVFSALGVQAPLQKLLSTFENQSGTSIDVTFEPTAVLDTLITEGARPDVIICTTGVMYSLVAGGTVDAASASPLVRSSIGVAVPAGAPHPNIDDVPHLVDALVAARAVAYSRSGASGQYFAELLERLGIADQVNARAVIPDKGFIAQALLDGRADLAIQQLSELSVVEGVEIVGALPEGAQQRIELSIGVGAHSSEPAAWQLHEQLTSPAAMGVFRAAHLEPATRSPLE